MRVPKLSVLATALLLSTSLAYSQSAQPGPNNPAVSTPGVNNSNRPVEGANSFTEGQAKSRLEAQGYSNVTDLKKDENGVWRAKATKGGSTSNVSLDFQGNINPAR